MRRLLIAVALAALVTEAEAAPTWDKYHENGAACYVSGLIDAKTWNYYIRKGLTNEEANDFADLKVKKELEKYELNCARSAFRYLIDNNGDLIEFYWEDDVK